MPPGNSHRPPVIRQPPTPGEGFCHACGTALSDAAAAPLPSTPVAVEPGREPVAEWRVCPVLFCDVAGFTPLAEARDPEAVRDLLSRDFEDARTIIGRYGGVVEKFGTW